MTKSRALPVALAIVLASSAGIACFPGGRLAAMEADDAVIRDADTVLQAQIFESVVRQLLAGAITVTYRDKLDADRATEAAIPGIHAAMIAAATATGKALLDTQLNSSRNTGRAALISAAAAPQLARVAYPFAPFARANANTTVTFLPGDTVTSAMYRAHTRWTAAPEYEERLAMIAREPGMTVAINKTARIAETYRNELRTIAAAAIAGALAAAHERANAYAAERGFEPPYPEKAQ